MFLPYHSLNKKAIWAVVVLRRSFIAFEMKQPASVHVHIKYLINAFSDSEHCLYTFWCSCRKQQQQQQNHPDSDLLLYFFLTVDID